MKVMKRYIFLVFLFFYVLSFSQERRIAREGNRNYLNNEFDISSEKYNESIALNESFIDAKFNSWLKGRSISIKLY